MARKRSGVVVYEDELDGHVPLYDREEFQQYAVQIVLPAIGVEPVARRWIKCRLMRKHRLNEHWIAHALEYLVMHDRIWSTVRGQGITYFALHAPDKFRCSGSMPPQILH